MDYLVRGTPDVVLNAGEAYFARDWRYGGKVTRTGVTLSLRIVYPEGCAAGCLGLIIAVATFGLMDPETRRIDTAQVVASPEGPNTTRLTITASRRDMQRDLEAWVEREFEAAAVDAEREPCWKCGARTTPEDVRCPSCGAWLRPQR